MSVVYANNPEARGWKGPTALGIADVKAGRGGRGLRRSERDAYDLAGQRE